MKFMRIDYCIKTNNLTSRKVNLNINTGKDVNIG